MATRTSIPLQALLVGLAMTAACRGEPVPAAHGAAPGGDVAAVPAGSGGAAAPAEQRCLPATICDQWAGCALVVKDPHGHWTVVAADRLKPGEPVRVENACTTGVSCPAAKAAPRDVTCPPIAVPPVISPPDYACVLDHASCRRSSNRP
jgi:hypothetical protein